MNWEAIITTTDYENAETDAAVYLLISGSNSTSGPILLDNPNHDEFERGQTDVFNFTMEDIGQLDHIVISISGESLTVNPFWRIDNFTLKNLDTSQEFSFNVDWWLDYGWMIAGQNFTLFPDEGKNYARISLTLSNSIKNLTRNNRKYGPPQNAK